jgi:hypothetical protein
MDFQLVDFSGRAGIKAGAESVGVNIGFFSIVVDTVTGQI